MNEQEFYEKIRAELNKAAADDRQLSAILEKIQSGTADFEDTQKYAERFSKLIGKVLSQNVTAPGSGLNAFAGYQLMKDGHADINQLLAVVQKSLDKQQNLHINPKTAKFPAERAGAVAHALEDRTVSQEVIERRARNAVSNVINSFHDNYIQENAQFRSRAGLRCYVARIGASKCCAWCASIAGRFAVGSEPADFWRRHDNCTCQISYENQKVRQRLSGNGKAWKLDAETQRRIAQRIQYKPTVFTPEQARELEARKLSQYKGLTIPGKTDIMNTRNPDWMGAPHTEKIPQKKKTTIFKTYKLNGYDNIWSQTYTANAQAMSEYLDNLLSTGKYGTLNRIIIAKKEKLGGIASYAYAENALYISEELINSELFNKLVSPDYFPACSLDEVIVHELGGHKRHWEAAERFYQSNQTKYPDLYSAKIAMESQLQEYVTRQVSSDPRYIANFVSENARKGFESSVPWKRLNELIADVNVRQQQGTIQDEFLSKLVKEILEYDANAT